jgi:hypothetical protein
VVLQHLQRLLLAVSSDDLGVTVLQQLLLPAIRERLQVVVATRTAHLTAADEAMQQLQALWELPGNADALEEGVYAQQKHAAALQELLARCVAAVKQFDRGIWEEFGTTGLETVAKVGGWLMMQGSKVVAGLRLLEQQAGKPAAAADGSSSSGASATATGSSSSSGACVSGSSNSSSSGASASGSSSAAGASATGGSSSSSSAEPGAVDVLVATTWGQCCELLLLIMASEREFSNNLPVEELDDAGKPLCCASPWCPQCDVTHAQSAPTYLDTDCVLFVCVTHSVPTAILCSTVLTSVTLSASFCVCH